MQHPLFEFIQEHHVLCLATAGVLGPHVCPLFYALDDEKKCLIFISDPLTQHMQNLANTPAFAAGIYLETEEVGKIQGAQLWGKSNQEDLHRLRTIYLKRFPLSQALLLTKPTYQFCALQIEKARLIDNKFGIGKKQEWIF